MASQKNIAFIQRLVKEIANTGNLSLYENFFSENILLHGPASNQEVQGLLKLKKLDASYNRAYPDKKFDIEEIFSQKTRIFVRWTCQGKYKTMHKIIRSKKPTDFTISGLSIYRIVKGKIAEIWQYWDRLGLLEQVGEIRNEHQDAIEPGYYFDLLRGLGMEKHVDGAVLLSLRERQCLKHLLEGKTAKDTALFYKLSHRTIESYFEKLKEKLKCRTKKDLFIAGQILEKLELL